MLRAFRKLIRLRSEHDEEDYRLSSVLSRAEQAKGAKLTDSEVDELISLADRLEAAELQLIEGEYEQYKATRANAMSRFQAVESEMQSAKRATDHARMTWLKELDQAKAELAEADALRSSLIRRMEQHLDAQRDRIATEALLHAKRRSQTLSPQQRQQKIASLVATINRLSADGNT